ncbi:helix-turn-helix domain-containing protein [Bacillus seohaeanensis]|jgi:DNA-directed RNA polymerase specialized sigma24 family protein|uniref:Helix-turn-helix domain-containing protein n=1 Tax=Bacillus seohaeanensis TaxID=284580 RepID=A0ABW5RRK3_9BACI
MNNLYQLMTQEKNRTHNIQLIIELFEPKIRKSFLQTNPLDREDLSQEIKIKLFESIKSYDVNSTPGFFEFKEMMQKTG